MANGKTIEEIRSLLHDKAKMSQGVVNRLTLSLMAEVYQNQIDSNAEDKKNREALEAQIKKIEARQDDFERRSVSVWIWKHPKAALVIMLSLYSFAISDIRQPVMDWFGEAIQAIVKVL